MADSFTPGPWITIRWVDEDDDIFTVGWKRGGIARMILCSDYQKETAVANARLIAAAPEILDALITSLPYVESAEDDPAYKPGSVAKVVKQIRDVIAKASGEKE